MALESILSAEPLPRLPVIEGEDAEVVAWRSNIHNYLRRLMGRFTDDNIGITPSVGLFEHVDDTFNSYTGDGTETTLKTVSIPSNTIVSGTMLAVEAMGRMTTTQASSAFSIRFKYNGAIFANSEIAGQVGLLTLSNLEQAWHGFAFLRFNSVRTAQRGSSIFNSSITGRFLGNDTLSEDTNLALNLTLTITLNGSAFGQTIGCDFFHIKAMKSSA